MTNSTDRHPSIALAKNISTFIASMVGASLLCLGAYALTVDRLIDRSAVPATYKWFLLKETPGPRIIFESGSNSHHAIDTDAVSKALGRTAINIADNGGYALEDKITRLETYSRPGDVIVLPLEWTFYHREKLTDNYVDTLFDSNRDYYQSMPVHKRISRALTLPPATVISKLKDHKLASTTLIESPAQDLFVSALTQPTGHQSRQTSSGPGAGVAEQSCDDYVLGPKPIRQNLKLGKNVKPALARLQKLKARGVDIHFAWPVLAGEACLTAPEYVDGFRNEIDDAINKAGFDFLGTPGQSLYGQIHQDDSPYHVISEATDIHTNKMIGFLRAEGYGSNGQPLNISNFARHRLLELELAESGPINQSPLKFGQPILMDSEAQRDQIDFTAGWWAFEPYGRWMRDNRAMFRITLPKNLPANTVLKIQGMTKSGRPEKVNVSVNGILISSGLFGESASLSVPVTGLPQGEALSIFIDLPEAGTPQSPKDLRESEDTRSMTLHLQTMELTEPFDPPIPLKPIKEVTDQDADIVQVKANTQHPALNTTKFENSCALIVPTTSSNISDIKYGNGWWPQELEGRWMRNKEASFDFQLPANTSTIFPVDYELRLVGDFFHETPQTIEYTLDGKNHGIAEPQENGVISIPLNALMDVDTINVALKFSNSKLVSPKDLGLSSDNRTLTYFLKSAELLPA